MDDEVKDALRLAVDYDNRPKPKSADARKLDVGAYQSSITSESMNERLARSDAITRELYAKNVKEPGPHASELGNTGEYVPVDVQAGIEEARKYGPSTVVDPEGRKGSPLFVAGTSPEGKNVSLNPGQQAALADHLSRVFKYKNKGDYAAGRTWANTQQKLPFGLSGSTLGINQAYMKDNPEFSLPHEIGHVLHFYQGRGDDPLAGASPEAIREFGKMAEDRWRFEFGADPQRVKYLSSGQEKWAEGIKAYLTDPAMFKAQYPEAAKFMRKIINTDPRVNKLLMLSRKEGPQYAAHGGEIEDALRLARNVKRNKYADGGAPTGNVQDNPVPYTGAIAAPQEDTQAIGGQTPLDNSQMVFTTMANGAPQTTAAPSATTPNYDPYQAYVNSLYQNVLGREADAGGRDYWANQLSSGAQNEYDILRDFTFSNEFQDMYRADPNRAIGGLYQAAFGRQADTGGLNYWVNQAQQGMGVPEITQNFINSPEGQNVSALNRAYRDYTGQMATPEQVASMQQQLAAGQDLNSILEDVYTSPSATTYVANQLYRDYTGNNPTPEQVSAVQTRLGNGEDYEAIAQDISASPESKNYLNTQFLNDTFEGYGLTPTEAQKNEFLNLMNQGTMSQLDIDKAIGKLPGAGTGDFEAPYQVAGPTVSSGKAVPTTPARYQEYLKNVIGSIGSTLSGGAQKLFDFIGQGEGGYNSANSGTGKGARMTHDASQWLGKNLTDFTLGEIMKMQEGTPKTGRKLFAVGKFQMIPGTLKELVKKLGIDTSLKFDEALQNKLGTALVLSKRPNLGKYLLGASNNEDKAMKEFSQEFMSVPYYKTGKSYITKGGNHPLHTVAQSRNALRQARLAGFGISINPNGETDFANPPPAPQPPSQPGAPPAADEASQEEFLHDQGIGVPPPPTPGMGPVDLGGGIGGVGPGYGGGIGGSNGGGNNGADTGQGSGPGGLHGGVSLGPTIDHTHNQVVAGDAGYTSGGMPYHYGPNDPIPDSSGGYHDPIAGWVSNNMPENYRNGMYTSGGDWEFDFMKRGGRVTRGLEIAKRAAGGRAIEDALNIAKNTRRGYTVGGTPTNLTAGVNPTANTAQTTSTAVTTPPTVETNPYQGYVGSLYQNILGRQADQGGLNYWANQLSTGEQTTQNVLEDFVKSQEYQDLYKTNPTQAVSGLYQAALGRAPDQGGLNYWVGRTQQSADLPALNPSQLASEFVLAPEFRQRDALTNAYVNYTGQSPTLQQYADASNALRGGATLSDVTASIAQSPAATQNFVKTAYKEMLGRPADAGGLQYWTDRLRSGDLDTTGFMNALANTVEGANWANTRTLDQTYREMLGRAPTQAEQNNYLSKLAAGTLNYEGLLSELSSDPEAINFQNTNLLNDTFMALTGRRATQAEQNDYLSKLAAGTIDPDQLFTQISSTPESRTFQLNNLVPKEWGPKTLEEANKSVPQDSAQLQSFFGPVEKTLGLPPGILLASMGIESTYGTNQRNLSTPKTEYLGAFQMGREERSKYGVANPFNWQQSGLGAAKYMAKNAETFKQKTGQQPTMGDFYGMHQQGANGWSKIVNNPNGLAAKSIGYEKLIKNLPDNLKPLASGMTNRQFREFLNGKVEFYLEGPDKKGRDVLKANPYGETPATPSSPTTPSDQPTFDQQGYDKALSDYQTAYNNWRQAADLYIVQELSYGNPNPSLPSWYPAAPTPPNPNQYVVAPPTSSGNAGQTLAGQGAGGNVAGNTGMGGGQINQPIGGPVSIPGFTVSGTPYQPIPDSAIAAYLAAGAVNPYIVQGGVYNPSTGGYGGGGYSGGYTGGNFSGSGSGSGTGISYMNKGGAVKDALQLADHYANGGNVWDKPRPKSLGKPKPLSSKQKSKAKAAAKAAGRPWPNMIDNIRAARGK